MDLSSPVARTLRSLVHRPPGESPDLPIEGRLGPFDGATGWLGSEPLTTEGLRGRVVLVDFWTYTCVNWIRTLPYLRAWDARYRPLGLTIVGVHTPEFGFERDPVNVAREVASVDIHYPVAIDSDYSVWRAFDNHYWPAVYIADPEGRVRYHHFGEGEYSMTEMVIQRLLIGAGSDPIEPDLVMVEPHGLEVPADWSSVLSGETYLGHLQAAGFIGPAEALDLPYAFPGVPRLPLNHWGLSGTWTVGPDAVALAGATGRIAVEFHARDVNLVMGPPRNGSPVPFQVLLDGEPPLAALGADLDARGRGVAAHQRTYQLIRQPGSIGERRLEVEFLAPGVEAFCFTFG